MDAVRPPQQLANSVPLTGANQPDGNQPLRRATDWQLGNATSISTESIVVIASIFTVATVLGVFFCVFAKKFCHKSDKQDYQHIQDTGQNRKAYRDQFVTIRPPTTYQGSLHTQSS